MSKLIPPDLSCCQAEKPNNCTIMSLGGKPSLVRCKNVPSYVATETVEGDDGLMGSMSLCSECKMIFEMNNDTTSISFSKIRRKHHEN